MLTRCPKCTTTFRVTPEQLKVRQGRVRCGECREVFNALDTLIELAAPVSPPQELPPSPVMESDDAYRLADEPAAPAPVFAEPAMVEAVLHPTPPELSLQSSGFPDAPCLPTEAEPKLAPQHELVVAAGDTRHIEVSPPILPAPPPDVIEAAEPDTESRNAASDALPDHDEIREVAEGDLDDSVTEPIPALEPELHEPPSGRKWPWLLGMFIALAALALQAAMHFRTEIAVISPATKPLLKTVCDTFGCQLLLPRKPELVGIESSDLHPEADGKLTLTASIRNRAPFAQEYPHLELTLTDTTDRPLVRRALAPADYLPSKMQNVGGFAANGDLTVNLAIEAPDVPAVGYRLYLFYP
jgi:predicted Zn finger-like uncharacterized protein